MIKLQYFLQKCNIGNTKSYYGQPEHRGSWDQERIIEEMMRRNSGTSRQMIIGVLNLLEEVVGEKLMEGYRINMDLVNMALVLKGTFEHEAERFDLEKHQVKLQATEGKGLKKLLRKFVPKRIGQDNSRMPVLLQFTDVATESRNTMTPGSMGKLTGYHMKLNLQDPEQGLWLINDQNERIAITTLGQNHPKTLMFQLPGNLAPGEYRFEIRNQVTRRGRYQTNQLRYKVTVNA